MVRQELLLAFFRSLCRLFRSFLLLDGRVELDGNHYDAVVLHTGSVGPLFGFEVALDGEYRALGQLVERVGVRVFAPSLEIDKSGDAVGFLAVLLQPAYCQRETCDTCVGELADLFLRIRSL